MNALRVLLAAGLAVAAASAFVAPVVRQQKVKQFSNIGTKPFQLIEGTAGSNCAKRIVHGQDDASRPIPTFFGFGVSGAVNFSQISESTEIKGTAAECKGTNSSGLMVLLSQDELNRRSKRAQEFLQLPEKALEKVYLAGIDTQPRRCGSIQKGNVAYYAWTKEIDAFLPRFRQLRIRINDALRASGDRWLLQYVPRNNELCVYVDVTATAFVKTRNGTVLPSPKPDPLFPSVSAIPLPVPNATDPVTGLPVIDPDLEAELSASPEASPGAGDGATNSSDGSVCFPGSATVETKDGFKPMSQVQIGDSVKVADGSFSDIFMFTHKMADAKHDFVIVRTVDAEIALTAGHYLYVNGNLAAARTVRVGDVVESASGSPMTVASVGSARMSGLYNPQTLHGDIIVDGVRASTFTTAVQPGSAQALMAPLRAAYVKLGFATAFLNQGSDFFARQMPSGAAVFA